MRRYITISRISTTCFSVVWRISVRRSAISWQPGRRGGAPGREGLRRTARAYVEYFVEYPGVFELFFLERLGGFGDRTETAALITGLLGRLCEPRLAECIADGTYTAGEAAAVEEGLRCMLPGMLLLYENRLAPDNYEEFMQSVDAQLGRVID